MHAAFYEANGPALAVMRVEEVETPSPGAGEVRVRLRASGVNPSDVKSRGLRKLAFPRVIPHSDGAGEIDAVGVGVPASRIGERVWVWNGQWQRPFGTAAEFDIVLRAEQTARLPDSATEQGATPWHPRQRPTTRSSSRARTLHGVACFRGRRVSKPVCDPVRQGAGRDRPSPRYPRPTRRPPRAKPAPTIASTTSKRRRRKACSGYHLANPASTPSLRWTCPANAKLIPTVLRPKGSVARVRHRCGSASIPAYFCLTNSILLQFFLVLQIDAQQRCSCLGRSRAPASPGLRLRAVGAIIHDVLASCSTSW